ncbi:beta-lactamase family protein [Candidatus Synechococcus calcipolaris G9]|uniref:Beta-lactamase family protein n=1 Tax=Candidatus Synechococcus calcipolaris G9 TaxID=1497997 RepID=A0ABT6F3H6_9SYNE|nr:serine hydrolase domain-containing protein [Candidatus Synechococcus calcipolaris]MDG2992332.1 beta-lactamase family protein [Candidatus Synechococcus calcipolaris G9]
MHSVPPVLIQSTPEVSPELTAAIDRVVEATLWENGPGVAVLILYDGEIIHQKGYGLRNVEEKLPITVDTAFDLASVSKQMTAMGILILMEAGALELDEAVTIYVPDFNDPDPDHPILISDLLYHRSGLADYTGEAWQGTDSELAQLTLEDHLQWLNGQNIERDRDIEFEYNNSGYALLALIIERVSGQPFAEFMEDTIFEPLAMNNTVVFSRLNQTIANQALGYRVSERGETELSSFPSMIGGDGNVFSTIGDLAHYDNALRGGDLIEPESLALAFTAGIEDDGEGAGYGLGWEIHEDYVAHSGSWYGTSTYYRHYTDQPFTLIVLSNNENYDGEDLTVQLVDVGIQVPKNQSQKGFQNLGEFYGNS